MGSGPDRASSPDRRTLLGQFAGQAALFSFGMPARALTVGDRVKTMFDAGSAKWEPVEIALASELVVGVKVNGQAARGILDSGSGATIIDVALARKLGIKGEARTISGLAAKAAVTLVNNVEVALGGTTQTLPFAIVSDLGAISAARGRPLDLLLGADLFVGRQIAIDFAGRRIAFAPSGGFGGGEGWTSVALSRGSRQELLVHAAIDGPDPVPLMIDTGSSAALMLSIDYAERTRDLLKGRHRSTAALGGVDGVHIVDLFTLDTLRIGSLDVNAIPAVGMRKWMSASSVGNIGSPLIAQFDAVFDVSDAKLWLRPLPSRRRLPMLKDRSGLGIAPAADGLLVVHVSSDSPAERAGWKAGERIVAVNGREVDRSYAFGPLWRWRFYPAGRIVTLRLQSGEVRTLRLADFY